MVNSSADPGRTESPTVKNVDMWLYELKQRVEKLETDSAKKEETIAKLVSENAVLLGKVSGLETRVASLESGQAVAASQVLIASSAPVIDYKSIAREVSKPGTSLNVAFVRAAKLNDEMSDKKIRNIVVVGLPNPKTATNEESKKEDAETVNTLIREMNKNATVKSTFRLKSKGNPVVGKPQPDPLVVEFENETVRNDILASAKNLSEIEEFKSVYLRPDRTISEQSFFNDLNKQRKTANDELKHYGKLDQPFRYVIRGEKLYCIDVTKKKTVHGRSVHPFVNRREVEEALEQH
jgi:hypothetical protein